MSDPRVTMITVPNPGPKTLEGTQTYVIGQDPAYILDPGPDLPPYQDWLAGWLRRNDKQVRGILVSHGHPDHAPGAVRLRDLFRVPIMAPAGLSTVDAESLGVNRQLREGDRLPVDGDTLTVFETPGHTADHLAFWLQGAGVLFVGDTILGRGTSVIAPPEGDMLEYLRTLGRLRELRPSIIAPGHGPIIRDPAAKIAEYIEHRRRREEQLLQAMTLGPATVPELVRLVYVDVDPGLHGLAGASTLAQLAKLITEGRVEQAGDVFTLRPTS